MDELTQLANALMALDDKLAACMMQLSDMLARNNDPVQVKHTIEIYAESLPL